MAESGGKQRWLSEQLVFDTRDSNERLLFVSLIDEGTASYTAIRSSLMISNQNESHNGVNSVAEIRIEMMTVGKSLK
jgi:hypothetical protein